MTYRADHGIIQLQAKHHQKANISTDCLRHLQLTRRFGASIDARPTRVWWDPPSGAVLRLGDSSARDAPAVLDLPQRWEDRRAGHTQDDGQLRCVSFSTKNGEQMPILAE